MRKTSFLMMILMVAVMALAACAPQAAATGSAR